MDAIVAGETAREMEKVHRALQHVRELLIGIDRVRAALGLQERESYSALRTLVEQAETSAERVHQALSAASGPHTGPDPA